jgi:hypothetical protein
MKKTILCILIFSHQFLLAQTTTPQATGSSIDATIKSAVPFEDFKALDYPELQVVPRASERLLIESQKNKDKGLFLLMPYVIPSLFTLSSGIVGAGGLRDSLNSEDRESAQKGANASIGIGALSLGVAFWYVQADFYGETAGQLRGLKGKDRRTELFKERMSEEAFERSNQHFSKAKWIFAVTHFLANASLAGKLQGDSNVIPVLGMITAFAPLLMTTDYETNYQRQLDYKKRIYVPLTLMDIKYNTQSQAWVPQTSFVWQF